MTILANKDAPVMEVRHADLRRWWPEESAYKSYCPACGDDGLLLVRRNQETFELLADDYCIHCAQHVRYLDIEEMREKLG